MRIRAILACGLLLASLDVASAITYTSGDVLYVAYRYTPSGAEYVVNLGPRSQFLNATSTMTLGTVLSSDLDAVVGATATNIWVGLFGVATPATQDGVLTANGPSEDFELTGSSMLGSVQQVNSFGDGLAIYGDPVPSGEATAVKFPSAVSGSYQASLNGLSKGSLGGNVNYSVETRLSSNNGTRISTPKKIPFFEGINNPVSGDSSRRAIGFFTLSGNGTITYSPDFDGDLIEDENDLCPGFTSLINTDNDGDDWGDPCDCDDADPNINPGASEVCNNGIDEDCDGVADGGVCAGQCADVDGDHYVNCGGGCAPAGTDQCGDCDDAMSAIHPGVTEACDNADNDCDGTVDAFATSCGVGQCAAAGTCTSGVDSCTAGASSPEVCDSLDNDCDGTVDDGVTGTYYPDADLDGFGAATGAVTACAPPGGYVLTGDDCDDSLSAIHPGAAETCNGIDDNCIAGADEGLQAVYYQDVDGDGVGNAGSSVLACAAPPGYVATAGDNCPAVANPTQADFDADGKGDLCDFTLTAPTDAAVISLSAPPTFTWLPENNNFFQVQFSTASPFKAKLKSKKQLVPGTSFTPTAKQLKKLGKLGKNGAVVYWLVIGSTNGAKKTAVASDQVFSFTVVP